MVRARRRDNGGVTVGERRTGGTSRGPRSDLRAKLLDRFRGAMIGVAIGDALGAPFEGAPPSDASRFSGWENGVPHPLRYTDDTHMTLGVARALVECAGRLDCARMAEIFANEYTREPWRGYGSGPPRVFELIQRGVAWTEAGAALFGGRGSFGNGAAMRSAPIGLLHFRRLHRADEVARTAARITHTHELGIDGAAIIACAVGLLVRASASGSLQKSLFLREILRHARTREFHEALETVQHLGPGAPMQQAIAILGNGVEAHRSVPIALHTFLRHRDSFAASILHAVSLGGDADTIASMTGALAGALHGASAIPPAWIEAVEGRDELIHLADGLVALV
jgi:poly(ADP-ribose) glycohydrolase ARH3